MGLSNDQREILSSVLLALQKLRNDRFDFIKPDGREGVSPYRLRLLKEGVSFYSTHYPELLRFKDPVVEVCNSSETSPETFEQPLYAELEDLLERILKEF